MPNIRLPLVLMRLILKKSAAVAKGIFLNVVLYFHDYGAEQLRALINCSQHIQMLAAAQELRLLPMINSHNLHKLFMVREREEEGGFEL